MGVLKDMQDHWESICNSCGQCCHERTLEHGEVRIDYHRACRFLNRSTGRCNVYSRRFQVYPSCGKVTIFHAIFDPWMPPDCAYVQRFRPWKRRSSKA